MGLVMLSDLGGGEVPFLKWMAIGIPMVIFLIPISWFVLLKFSPPEISHISENPEEKDSSKEPFSVGQKKVMVIFGIVIVLWLLSNWFFKALDVTMIALIGSVVLFLPIVGVSTWKEASKGIGWDILFMIGAVSSIGLASSDTGLATWVVSSIFDGADDISVLWLLVAISTFTVLIHFVVPIGPVVNAVTFDPRLLTPFASLQFNCIHWQMIFARALHRILL